MLAEVDPEDPAWIVLHAELRDKELVKMIPGASWSAQRRVWRVRCTWSAARQLRGVFGDRLEVGPALKAWAWAEAQSRVMPAAALHEAVDAPGDERLYTYQRVGVSFLRTARGAILADDMGTGKTVQTLMALGPDALPALVVAPKSVLRVGWEAEAARWAPDLRVVAVVGAATQRRKLLAEPADVYLMTYGALAGHTRLAPYGSVALRKCEAHGGSDPKITVAKCEVHDKELQHRRFATVVFDEAHRLKDPKAKQTRAAWQVASAATYRWALTGTPVEKNPGDLWSLLHLVAPDEWPAKTSFVDRYCLTSFNPFSGFDDIVGLQPATRTEFFSIVDSRMLRRTKEEVLPDLPPKVYTRREVELKGEQKRVYAELKKDMVARVESGESLEAFNPLSLDGRLMQAASATLDVTHELVECEACCCVAPEDRPPVCPECDGSGEVWHQTVTMVEPSSKIDGLVELLGDLGGAPAVVFAASKQLVHLAARRLQRLGITAATITGDADDLMRQEAVQRFQEGRLEALLLTYGAGGEGLTLTRSSQVIRMQRPQSLIKDKQAEDRVHRPGQLAERVTITDLVTAGTVEDGVLDLLDGKDERFEEVVRDRERVLKMLRGGSR